MQGSADHAHMPSPVVDVGEGDGPGPFTLNLTRATSLGLSPRWVQYSGVTATARAIAEALTDLVTMGHVDQAPTLDREYLAYAAGLSRADQTRPFLQELQDIGFLVIAPPRVNPRTGKQSRGSNGRPLPDRFAINLEPPAEYAGPRNLTEFHTHFLGDRQAAYQVAKETGKRVRAGNVAIRRTEFARTRTPQVNGDTTTVGQGLKRDTGTLGQAGFPQVIGDTTGIGSGRQAVTQEPWVKQGFRRSSVTQPELGHLQIDQRSSISEGEIEDRSIEPVPGGAAQPPATGMDERQAAEVRELVRQLPWIRWAELRGTKFQLMQGDADVLQAAICEAMASAGITLDQAAEVGRAALGEAKTNPVGYVTDAFRRHLPRRLRALAVEPLADNPLPLPGTPDPQVSGSKPGKQGKGPAAAVPDDGEKPKPELPACTTCDCGEGEEVGNRTVVGADGRHRRCPDCRPAAA